MRLLKMLTSIIVLRRPLAAVLRSARPTSHVTRAAFFAFGTLLVFGGLDAMRDGGRDGAAAVMIASGGALVLLRRRRTPKAKGDGATALHARAVLEAGQPVPEAAPGSPGPLPSAFLRAGWCRNGLAMNQFGDRVAAAPDGPDKPIAWSLAGAAFAAFSEVRMSGAYERCVAEILSERGISDPDEWSGDPQRTREEVVAVAVEAERRMFHQGHKINTPPPPPPPEKPPPSPELDCKGQSAQADMYATVLKCSTPGCNNPAQQRIREQTPKGELLLWSCCESPCV